MSESLTPSEKQISSRKKMLDVDNTKGSEEEQDPFERQLIIKSTHSIISQTNALEKPKQSQEENHTTTDPLFESPSIPSQPSHKSSSLKLIAETDILDEIITGRTHSQLNNNNNFERKPKQNMHQRMSSSNPLLFLSPETQVPSSSMITGESPKKFETEHNPQQSPSNQISSFKDFRNRDKPSNNNNNNNNAQTDIETQQQATHSTSIESLNLLSKKSRFFPTQFTSPQQQQLQQQNNEDSLLSSTKQPRLNHSNSGTNDTSINERAFFTRKTYRLTRKEEPTMTTTQQTESNNYTQEFSRIRQNSSSFFPAVKSIDQQQESTISTTTGATLLPKRSVGGGGWNFAIHMKNINRFISKIRDQTSDQNFTKLLPHHLSLINDASFQQEGGSKDFFEVSTATLHRGVTFLERMPIFEPDGNLMLIFKLIVLFALMIQVFIIPIEIGFSIDLFQASSGARTFLKDIPTFVFFADLFCRLNTGFYYNGSFVQDRARIPKYFFWMLLLDCLNIAAMFVISTTDETSVFVLIIIFLGRFILLYKKVNDVLDHFSILERFPISYNLTKLVFILLIVGHACGCGFHYLSIIESEETNWIEFYKFTDLTLANRYIVSIYFSTITMITVGYGEITPQNQRERLYVIFIVIVSGTVFAYTVNMIGQLFQEKEKKIAVYKQMKFDISNYLENRQISKKTQLKVYNYLDYINKKANESPEKGQRILNMISENLKNDVYKEFYGQILTNSKLFHNKFSHEFIEKVSLRMEEKMYGPGEIIFLQDSTSNPCLYYILKGKIEMFSKREDQKHTLGFLKNGDSLGHRCFNATQPHEFSTITSEVTHLVFISQSNFLECLKEFPLDNEIFMMTKETIIFGQNRYIHPCYSCSKMTHTSIECPLIHYTKNRQLCINRYLYSVPEKDRRPYSRKRRVKSRSLNSLNQTRSLLKTYRLDLTLAVMQRNSMNKSRMNYDFLKPVKESDKKFFKRLCKFKFTSEKDAQTNENQLAIDSQNSEPNESTDSSNDEEYADEDLQYIEESGGEDEEYSDFNRMDSPERESMYSPSPTLSKKKGAAFASTSIPIPKKQNKLPFLRKKTLANETTTTSKSIPSALAFRRSKTIKFDLNKKSFGASTEQPQSQFEPNNISINNHISNSYKVPSKFSLQSSNNNNNILNISNSNNLSNANSVDTTANRVSNQNSHFQTPKKLVLQMQPIRFSQIVNVKPAVNLLEDSIFPLPNTESQNDKQEKEGSLDTSILSQASSFKEKIDDIPEPQNISLSPNTNQIPLPTTLKPSMKLSNTSYLSQLKEVDLKLAQQPQQSTENPPVIFTSLLSRIKTAQKTNFLPSTLTEQMPQIQLPVKSNAILRFALEEKTGNNPSPFTRQNSNSGGGQGGGSGSAGIPNASSSQNNTGHSPSPLQTQFNALTTNTVLTTPFIIRKKDEFFGLSGFENMKEFQVYFPSFNYSVILKKFNSKITVAKRRKFTLYPMSFQRKTKKKPTSFRTAAQVIPRIKGLLTNLRPLNQIDQLTSENNTPINQQSTLE